MAQVIYIGIGGFIGAILRYLVVIGTGLVWSRNGFPLGTLVVNALGCLIFGFIGGFIESRTTLSAEMTLFICTGILGAFTTFSAFGFETFSLLQKGLWVAAATNILAQMSIGLLTVFGGYTLGRIA